MRMCCVTHKIQPNSKLYEQARPPAALAPRRVTQCITQACHWKIGPEKIGPRINFSSKILVPGPEFSENNGPTLKILVPLSRVTQFLK